MLILGLSSIVRRRVLPALALIDSVERIDVASASKRHNAQSNKLGQYFTDYAHAIASSNAELAYISLPNALHEVWITAVLEAGKHVIVDKPATLDIEAALRVVALARKSSRLIAEATVFNYHPQIEKLLGFVAESGPLTHIDAQLIIPPLPEGNYRNSRSLGGGCLLDMGPYAAAVNRLFGGKPERLAVFAAPEYPGQDVDMGFSLLAQYADGLRYTGHFSFEGEYQNRLQLIGRDGSLLVDRIFTPPGDAPVLWRTRRNNKVQEVAQPAADTFCHFLTRVIGAVESGCYGSFETDMLSDAGFRDLLLRHIAPLGDTAVVF